MIIRIKHFHGTAAILVAVGVSILTCAAASAADVKMQVDFSYRQFKANPDGTCPKQTPPPANAHASLGGIFIAWIAGKIVSSLGAAAAKEVKKYSSERESDPQYGNFYDSGYWVTPNAPLDQNSLLSCWELLERECPKSDAPCPNDTARLAIVGLYSRDQSALKVVPTNVAITGLAAKVDKNGKKATIAVSQTVTAVWLDGDRGRRETMYSEVIFKKKFDYSPQKQEILPSPSAVDLAKAIAGSGPLPLPPVAARGPAYVGVSFKVAEANNAPKLLAWLAEFLTDKHDDLSTELAAALDDL